MARLATATARPKRRALTAPLRSRRSPRPSPPRSGDECDGRRRRRRRLTNSSCSRAISALVGGFDLRVGEVFGVAVRRLAGERQLLGRPAADGAVAARQRLEAQRLAQREKLLEPRLRRSNSSIGLSRRSRKTKRCATARARVNRAGRARASGRRGRGARARASRRGQPVLFFGGHLAEAARMAVGNEDRIVAEAAPSRAAETTSRPSTRPSKDSSRPSGQASASALTNAARHGGAAPRAVSSRSTRAIAAAKSRSFARPARRIDARRAVERRRRTGPESSASAGSARGARRRARLQRGVGGEAVAGLLRLGEAEVAPAPTHSSAVGRKQIDELGELAASCGSRRRSGRRVGERGGGASLTARRSCSAGRRRAARARSRPLSTRNWPSARSSNGIRCAIVSAVSPACGDDDSHAQGRRRGRFLGPQPVERADRGAEARVDRRRQSDGRRRSADRRARPSRTAPSRKLHCSPCATAIAIGRSPPRASRSSRSSPRRSSPRRARSRASSNCRRDAVEPQRLSAALADADQRRRLVFQHEAVAAPRRRSRAWDGGSASPRTSPCAGSSP